LAPARGGPLASWPVAGLPELERLGLVDEAQLNHLKRLVGSWGFLADLCFADLLLFVPVEDEGRFVVAAQVRPTTGQTLYPDDEVGRIVTADERPHMARSWELRQVIDASHRIHDRGEVADIRCIPVSRAGTLLAVMTRESAPSVGRRSGELERVYVEIFDHLARMITAGEFPFDSEDDESDKAPRVGDGLARLDATGRVDFASPNFVSALHRMGIHANVLGARLGEVGLDESAVRAAFTIGGPITEEVDREGVVLLLRCVPLRDQGSVAGAVVTVRDVSDLRRRDRLLISKDVTIREIHHRVKNNLQTISSLLRLQARRLTSEEARAALADAEARVRSMAVVHETLSASGAASQLVDFGDIVRLLVRQVNDGLVLPGRRVEMAVSGTAGNLRAEVATRLAVIITELLQNAVRHAFRGERASEPGHVRVALANEAGAVVVSVSDDGVGLVGDASPASTSLGLTIVNTLVEELGGKLTVASGDGASGTTIELRVPPGVRRVSPSTLEDTGETPAVAGS